MSCAAPIHVWYHCHHCRAAPIEGRRYTCETCPAGPDNDLCAACYEKYRRGELSHPPPGSPASIMDLPEHVFASSEGQPRDTVEGWLEPPHPAAAAPPLAERFVLRPEFRAGVESFLGSYAFVVGVEADPRPVVLTALHVMDELIRRHGVDATDANAGYSGRELPSIVTEVRLYDVFAANWVLAERGSAAPMLVLPGARLDDEEPYSDRDVAAFRVRDGAELAAGRLARRPPRVGEAVWVAAKTVDRPPRRLQKAVVVEVTDRSLVFRYEDPALEAPYSSGAPLIDGSGNVVGVNVGGGRLDGHKLGHANHVGNLRRHLEEGLRNS